MPVAFAAEGDLDSSFGTGGRVSTPVGAGPGENAMAIDAQGRIVVAGSVFNGADTDVLVVRYLPNGALDTSFSGDGIAVFDFPASPSSEHGNAVAIDPQGRILVAGDTAGTGTSDLALIRVEPDGTLDTSFGPPGSNGFVKQDLRGSDDTPNAVAVDSQGRIVVAGYSMFGGDNDFSVARFGANATSLDSGFGTGGIKSIDFTSSGGDDDRANAMALDAQGRILLAGESLPAPGVRDFALARLNPDGSRDATFGTNAAPYTGEVTTPIGTSTDRANAVTIDPQGRIVAAGEAMVGSESHSAIARYNADGSLDNTFSDDGKVITPLAAGLNAESAHFVGVDRQGRIVAAGRGGNGSTFDYALARYTSSGALDPAFGGGGKVTVPDGFGAAAAFDAQDRIVVAGRTAGLGKFGLARFIGDATPPAASIDSGPAQGSLTNDPTPTFEFSSSESGSSFACGFDGLSASCSSPFTPAAALGDGGHTFSVTATDRAGNASAAATRTFTVDTTKPSLKIKGKGTLRTRKKKARERLKLKSSEPVHFTCRVDKRKPKACGAKYTTPKLKRGKHKVKVTATDRAGNTATARKKIRVLRKRRR